MSPIQNPYIILEAQTILQTADARTALGKLNQLPQAPTLFVVDEQGTLVGTISDGDVRRGLLNDLSLETPVADFANVNFRALQKGGFSAGDVQELRRQGVTVVPLLDEDGRILRIFNLARQRSILPVDAVIIAGGRGSRLRPFTDVVPKPLLPLAGKPIVGHIFDRLALFGIQHVHLSVGYLAEQFRKEFPTGERNGLSITYIEEESPLGTFGPVGRIDQFDEDIVLVMNADLLTNIDLEDMMLSFEEEGADMMVASIPYEVSVPYAILETEGNRITEFREKPTYTYYANAGIYLIKKSLLKDIPASEPYQATDLMRELIDAKHKVCYYPILGYWLDIGTPQDYEKAKRDIGHIQF